MTNITTPQQAVADVGEKFALRIERFGPGGRYLLSFGHQPATLFTRHALCCDVHHRLPLPALIDATTCARHRWAALDVDASERHGEGVWTFSDTAHPLALPVTYLDLHELTGSSRGGTA